MSPIERARIATQLEEMVKREMEIATATVRFVNSGEQVTPERAATTLLKQLAIIHADIAMLGQSLLIALPDSTD